VTKYVWHGETLEGCFQRVKELEAKGYRNCYIVFSGLNSCRVVCEV